MIYQIGKYMVVVRELIPLDVGSVNMHITCTTLIIELLYWNQLGYISCSYFIFVTLASAATKNCTHGRNHLLCTITVDYFARLLNWSIQPQKVFVCNVHVKMVAEMFLLAYIAPFFCVVQYIWTLNTARQSKNKKYLVILQISLCQKWWHLLTLHTPTDIIFI